MFTMEKFYWFIFLVVTLNGDTMRLDSKHVPDKKHLENPEYDVFSKSAVASDAVPCAEAGDKMLLKNGSAVDAAIATLLCIGVYNPESSGIGGGFFMVIYNREKREAKVIDAREEAPAAATEDMFHGDSKLSAEGPLAIAVPGEIRGMAKAHQMYGRLPWADLFEPSVELARKGFPIGKELAMTLRVQRDQVLNSPTLSELFVDPKTGDVFQEGDILKNPRLADTLQRIATNGADEFYLGETAKKFISDIKELGGILTADDLANYQPVVKSSTVAKLSGGLTLYSTPPPGSGYILSFILRVLDQFNMTKKNLLNIKEQTLTYHRFIEALKYGYAYRTKLGDERFVDLKQTLSDLTSEKVILRTKENIKDDQTFEPEHYGPELIRDDHGTAHLSVITANGDAVTVTSTINYWFGAGIVSRSTGIVLNNEMDDFSAPNITNTYGVPPSVENYIRPGKRPQSSTCPSIFTNENGDVVLAIGGAGGTRITSSVSLTCMRHLWLGKDLNAAIHEARIHHQLFPNSIEYESKFPKPVLQNLEKIGHKLRKAGPFGSIVVGIKRFEDGHLLASYDYRRGGSIAGF